MTILTLTAMTVGILTLGYLMFGCAVLMIVGDELAEAAGRITLSAGQAARVILTWPVVIARG